MSKEEDLAKEFLKKLVSHTTLYKGTIDELEVYEPDDVIWAYKEGYHQAQKDNELTWEDMEAIQEIANGYCKHHSCEPRFFVYKEVLKRFRERKEK